MLTAEEDVLSPAQQREEEGAAARAAARAKAAAKAAKAQSRFPRVASWSSMLPRVGSSSSLAPNAADTTAPQAPTARAAARAPPELQSPPLPPAASTEAPEALPVNDDIDAWPGQLEGGGIDYRFLSRHLVAAEVRALSVGLGLKIGARLTS